MKLLIGAAIGALLGGLLAVGILAPNWKHVPSGESGGIAIRAILSGTVIGAFIAVFL